MKKAGESALLSVERINFSIRIENRFQSTFFFANGSKLFLLCTSTSNTILRDFEYYSPSTSSIFAIRRNEIIVTVSIWCQGRSFQLKHQCHRQIVRFNSPIINREIVTWFEGGPANPLAPHAAPPSEHATPPKAITAIKPNDFGLWNIWPQHPFLPECSDGDLKWKLKRNSILSYSDVTL